MLKNYAIGCFLISFIIKLAMKNLQEVVG